MASGLDFERKPFSTSGPIVTSRYTEFQPPSERPTLTVPGDSLTATMLTTITLDGFRSFRHYAVEGLGRVNLFLGGNNCGKTSLLEAIEFLVSKGEPSVLLRASDNRGEQSPISEPATPARLWTTNVTHLFHGHDFDPESGKQIEIVGTHGYGPITVRVRPLTQDERRVGDEYPLEPRAYDLPLGLEIGGSSLHPDPVFAIGRDGVLRSRRRLGTEPPMERKRPAPIRFFAPRSLSASDIRRMWDIVQMEGRESEFLDIVRVVEPDLESLHFLVRDLSVSPQTGAASPATGILSRLRDHDRRVPLGVLGDGTHQLLALSLSLIEAADGFLLADGLDNNLHWTVMRDLWTALVEASRRSSVQIFATTQSLDGLRGLAALYRKDPELASEVTVFKMDRRLPQAVRLSADNVDAAVTHGIEIR